MAGAAVAAQPVWAPENAALPKAPPQPGREVVLPEPLEVIDAERYRRIFALQEAGQWRAADRFIETVRDTRLMGHVLAQRYRHPTEYTSTYRELTNWLELYADEPEGPAIYRLARKKRPRGMASPKPPVTPPAIAVDLPRQTDVNNSRHWRRGLAAWRKGNMSRAAEAFEKLALESVKRPWALSAGAYWAARAHEQLGNREEARHWLERAADQSMTFYGELARSRLGLGPAGAPPPGAVTRDGLQAMARSSGGQRALALLQVGQRERALQELTLLEASPDSVLAGAAAAIARQERERTGIVQVDATPHEAYPVPSWTPRGGFTVDRSLVYAVARQESGFNPKAKNPSGARGLMQLMPATAGLMAGNTKRFNGKRQQELLNPELNLALGQEYLGHLLEQPEIDGNLILMTAAWNAGPGNLEKWRKSLRTDDPLLFIERIPARETRLFVQRVLTDSWVYGTWLGNTPATLQDLAADRWPMFRETDATESE